MAAGALPLVAAIAALLLVLLAVRRLLAWRGPHAASSPSPSADPFAAAGVLLVTAHPDDECMFFAPAVAALARLRRVPVHILCLAASPPSRARELLRAAQVLGVPADRVHAVDTPVLRDGFDQRWPAAEIQRRVRAVVQDHAVTQIITFDEHGVSGHPNHVAIARALRTDPTLAPLTWHLRTTSLAAKYAGVWLSRMLAPRTHFASPPQSPWALGQGVLAPTGTWVVVSRPAHVERARAAMRMHASQLVWFRRLYIRFSRYMVVNELVPSCPRGAESDRKTE